MVADISLKWRILWLFFFLGLLPQTVLSYLTISAYTSSLEDVTGRHVRQLITQAAEQTDTRLSYLLQDLHGQATQPHLQLSFQQFPQEQRMQLVQERLALFRDGAQVYSRLSLCSLSGERLVSVADHRQDDGSAAFERQRIAALSGGSNEYGLFGRGEDTRLVLFLPVPSYRQEFRTVGFLVGYIPLADVTVFLRRLDLGPGTAKAMVAADDTPIAEFPASGAAPMSAARRIFQAPLAAIDCRIEVQLAEDDLLADVHRQKYRNMLFIGITVAVAFVSSIIFSHYFTRPFKRIIAGTRTFAAGDLGHRITVRSGHEAKELAIAFNEMAGRLHDRQQELNRASRLASLGVMTAGIAHEIKNPLAGIKTSCQVIGEILSDKQQADHTQQGSLSPAELDEILELAGGISQEIDRVTSILRDLLQFGKPRAPEMVACDMAEIVRRARRLLRMEFDRKQVEVDLQVSSLPVLADPDQLLQVMINLLLNALEAVPERTGIVRVIGEYDTSGAPVLRIIDNGQGIAENKLPHIFDPFFSLREGGVGLGLSMVYTLLRQNGAHLRVASEVGRGSEFAINFALRAERGAERVEVEEQ